MIALIIAVIALIVAVNANRKANEALRGLVTIDKGVDDLRDVQ